MSILIHNNNETKKLKRTLIQMRDGDPVVTSVFNFGYMIKLTENDYNRADEILSYYDSNHFIKTGLARIERRFYTVGDKDRPYAPESNSYCSVLAVTMVLTDKGKTLLEYLETYPDNTVFFDMSTFMYNVDRTYELVKEELKATVLNFDRYQAFANLGSEFTSLNSLIMLEKLSRTRNSKGEYV